MANKQNYTKVIYAISFAWQIGFLVAIPLILFLLLGIWIDKRLHTLPLFLFLSTVLGLAITIYEVYHLLRPFLLKDTKKDD